MNFISPSSTLIQIQCKRINWKNVSFVELWNAQEVQEEPKKNTKLWKRNIFWKWDSWKTRHLVTTKMSKIQKFYSFNQIWFQLQMYKLAFLHLPIYMWLFTIWHSVHGAIAISGYILPYLHMLRCGRVTPPIELGGQLWQSRPGQDRARLVVVPIRLQLLFLRWAEHRGHPQTTWSVLGPSTNDVIPFFQHFYPSFPHITTIKTPELSNVPRYYTPDSLKYGDVIYGWPLIIKNHSQNCWRVTRRRRAWRKMLPWRCATSSHLHVIWMDENSRGSLTTVNTNASPHSARHASPIEAWIFRATCSRSISPFWALFTYSGQARQPFKSSKIKRLYITGVDQFRFCPK